MRIQNARPRPQAQRPTDGAWGSIYKKRRMFKIPAYDLFSIVLMSAGTARRKDRAIFLI
jgi:hypothetical protein